MRGEEAREEDGEREGRDGEGWGKGKNIGNQLRQSSCATELENE